MKNDVYKFRYSEDFLKNYKGIGDLYHCFDGILIERQYDDKIYWEDTYWSSDNRRFNSMEEIKSKGTIKFLCNLEEMEEIEEHQVKYYNPDDVISLRIHKGYRSKHLIKKGVEYSKDVIIEGIKQKIKESESNIQYELRRIESLKNDIELIERGEKELKHIYF